MTIEKPLWLGPHPTTGEAPEYSAQADRAILATLFTEGIGNVQAGELLVTQRAAGAAMSVEVAAGTAYITGDDVPRQGLFRTVVTATETVPIGAAPAANSRIDLVVLRTYDAVAVGGAKHGTYLEVVQGVAAASPAVPALPPTAIALAQVLVAAGAASIVTANITDRRTQAGANTLKVGTQFQLLTTAQRDALTGAELYEGRAIYNTTTKREEHYVAGAWSALVPEAVWVSTTLALPAITSSGTDTLTVPLGVAFRSATVQIEPNSSADRSSYQFFKSRHDITTRSAETLSSGDFSAQGYAGITSKYQVDNDPSWSPFALGLMRWNNATNECISDISLSGTNLLIGRRRAYQSSTPMGAATARVLVKGVL